MSLALDNLAEYLKRAAASGDTKADFARASGVHPSLITNILDGDVALSGKNVPKILQGFRTKDDRLAFLLAYLHDEIPQEHANEISVQLAKSSTEGLAESSIADAQEAQLLEAFFALPSDAYRRRVVTLVRALRSDAQLRDLFKSTVDYIQPDDASQAAKIHAAAKAALAKRDQSVQSPALQNKPQTPQSPPPAAPR